MLRPRRLRTPADRKALAEMLDECETFGLPISPATRRLVLDPRNEAELALADEELAWISEQLGTPIFEPDVPYDYEDLDG